ncbi:HAMP domain-containing sensor histidine kinase [Actinomadura macrotermitis]|uniref:histidine kinase n=1 Tax=Actinomadura macrotermitis TaxID=2585200 RepID=A0A7K0C098_9ACTN|nr:HAMP domain-containing sensor histidine kinase [Actinomadura macrotermitis]MQY06861.1 Signal transduction histidine-protein kinase/phosphatase MprB [Actinomadura macrotermitis]
MSGGRWRRARLRTRLAAATAGVMALIVTGLTAGVYVAVRHELDWQLNLVLRRSLDDWRKGPQARTASPPWVSSVSCSLRGPDVCVQTIPAGTPAGTVGRSGMPVTVGAARVAAGRAVSDRSDVMVNGARGRALTVQLEGGAVQAAVQSQTYANSVARLQALLLALGAAGIALAAGAGWLVARAGLGGVTRLTETAELIAATGDPRRRVELPVAAGEPGRDEVARLAGAFDTMLDVLERSLAARRRLVADASHELRTPLTALRTNIDILGFGDRLTPAQRDRAVAALSGQLRSITGLVDDLVELARGKEPPALLEDVRLDELVLDAVATARANWPRIVFEATTTETVVTGVPARLARLISTVLDNAAKFSPDGGTVEVVLTTGELTIRDHGPGIAEEDLPYIFDHFYRARSARALPGSGLGLAMARQIAVSHEASLDAENAPGGGTLIRLRYAATQP